MDMEQKDPKRLREQLQLTQRGLAEELGVALPTVGRWECGRLGPLARIRRRQGASGSRRRAAWRGRGQEPSAKSTSTGP